jgi:fermentation-respiration switch protein FrsA (DUF1100 family)
MERTDITFSSRGRRCTAWLYRPDREGPHACVVMAHGFGAVKEARLGGSSFSGGHAVDTPPGPARKMAEAAPRGELVELPIDHWQAYRAEWFERIVELETDFLRRHLEPAPRSDAVPARDAAGHPGG